MQGEVELEQSRLKGTWVSENVFNLSKKCLTKDEVSLLSKGLNFCPTPKDFDKAEVKRDLEEFGRRLRLKCFFRDEDSSFEFTV